MDLQGSCPPRVVADATCRLLLRTAERNECVLRCSPERKVLTEGAEAVRKLHQFLGNEGSRLIRQHDLDAIYITGRGPSGQHPLKRTYSDFYSGVFDNAEGINCPIAS